MFKKLKEKITEEVKSSPQRFAEFTQTVSDRLQNNTTPDESFFSIGDGDDDVNTSGTSSHGFSSVPLVSPSQEYRTRRNSGGSIASDISFLPRYESSNPYHLQSDLDISASELEDNASTSSSQLGHLSKEQIYSAFQKSQMRYHKYRGRYTDLARHYKDLEREIVKMKSVLVETQDKAIRRVTELKEQCSLEQKAKAHLESALRDEIDERNYKIKALQTKIELLQKDNSSDVLVNVEENQTEKLENLTKYLNEARKEIEILNEKIQELKANAIVSQSKGQDYKLKITNLEKEMNTISEREKENNLILAQNKMELHNEILNKDSEISTLKRENEILRQNLSSAESDAKSNTKLENLQTQNKKLIEKLETLTKRSNYLENELLKLESYKLELGDLKEKQQSFVNELSELQETNTLLTTEKTQLENELRGISEEYSTARINFSKDKEDLENQISSLREDAKQGLLSLEPKIREKLQSQFLEKESELKQEFANKIEELSSNDSNLKDIKLQLISKDDTIAKITEELSNTKEDLSKKMKDYNNLENNHIELIEDCTKLRNTISNLEKENSSLEVNQDKLTRLEAHINTLQEELRELGEISDNKEKDVVSLSKENVKLLQTAQEATEKLKLMESKLESKDLNVIESKLLEVKVEKLEEEKLILLSEFETERKMFEEMLENHKELIEKKEEIVVLKEELKECRDEICRIKIKLDTEVDKNLKLSEENFSHEKHITKLEETVRLLEEKDITYNLDKNESKLLELKLKKLEEEKLKLMNSFEMERKDFSKELRSLKSHLSNSEDEHWIHNDNEIDLQQEILDIKEINERKEKEIVDLSQENANFQQETTKLQEKVRLLEEEVEHFELQKSEDKLLELKLQKSEEEKDKLLTDFEMERKMYNGLLENHRELQEKEIIIQQLDTKLGDMHKEITKLTEHLNEQTNQNIKISEDKLILEQTIRKLEEKIIICKEKEEAISINKTECSLLEMKLQELEAEKKHLMDTFELERVNFEKIYVQEAKSEQKIKHLSEEKERLKAEFESTKNDFQQLLTRSSEATRDNEALKSAFNGLEVQNRNKSGEIEKLLDNNTYLQQEVKMKDELVLELSNKVAKLADVIEKQRIEFNDLLEKTSQLDKCLEVNKNDYLDQINKEQTKYNKLISRAEVLEKDLEEKSIKLDNSIEQFENLQKLYKEEKENHIIKAEKLHELHAKIEKLNLVEENLNQITEEKTSINQQMKQIQDEKVSLENKLKETEATLKEKNNQMEINKIETNNLVEDRTSLQNEIIKLQTKVTQLSREINNMKENSQIASNNELQVLQNENRVLKDQIDTAKNEITQMNLRIQQVTVDNRNIMEESQTLQQEKEELELKLQNDVLFGSELKTKFEEQIISHTKTIEEISDQLKEVQKQNEELLKDKTTSNISENDLSKIQQNFYDIKEKFDKLFIENKNLKVEYTKLEEKCNDFVKTKHSLETQIGELESQYMEILHEKQFLQDEIQELKITPVNYVQSHAAPPPTSALKLDQLEILKNEALLSNGTEKDTYLKEIESLRDKLTKYKSLDITNKSSIEFYENELEKLKNHNDKLNRKLDETLVTLNHCAELSTSSTEVEYLKNVLYNYMLGKESLILARVIAAVCKFDPQQTEIVLQREQQKQSLLGQLGFI